jgi:hypothetical protein
MSKKAFFILLPLIAILFGMNCVGDNVNFFKKGSEGLVLTQSTIIKNAPFSVSLKTEHNNVVKNKIRIKACDDYSAIDISHPCPLASEAFYYHKPIFHVYAVDFESSRFSKYHLRGPPANSI